MSSGGLLAKLGGVWDKLLEQRQSDKFLLSVILLLVVIGLIMLFSASSVVAYQSFQDSYHFFRRQLFSLGLGFAAFWLLSKFNYQYLRHFALGALVISLVLLTLVFVPGLVMEQHGSRSWVEIFGFSFQPAELVKLTFLVYLSAWFARKQEKYRQTDAAQKSTPFFILYAIVAILMLAQPDLGTLLIMTVTFATVYLVAGGKIKYLLVGGLLGLIGLSLIMTLPRFDYQKYRFLCALDAGYSLNDQCYQINQSLIAVGSGGWWGRGLGASRQKFLYLPEVQTDFIFSVVGEELGFVFSGVVVGLFFLLFYRGYLIAKRITDDFGRNLAIGIVTWLTAQALVNIGGIIGLLPMTGVPLPFISYGGTALIAALAALGILLNISKQVR